MTASKYWIGSSCLLLAVYLALVVFTFRDYGIGWDEPWHATQGDSIIHWYSSAFEDHEAIRSWNLRNYGGLFDVIAQLAARTVPLDTFQTRHMVNALFGLLALASVYKVGTIFAGPFAGFCSLLLLLLTPRFYGDVFTNPKDIPFAALSSIALYSIIVAAGSLPKLSRRLIFQLGITVGLTLAVRIGGVLLLAYLALAFALWCMRERPRRWWSDSAFVSTARGLVWTYAKICTIAYVAMLPWWPAAQAEPLLRPLKALWRSSHSDFGTTKVFFEGHLTPASEISRRYLIEWMLITLPEFYFVGLAVAVIITAGVLWRRRKRAMSTPRLVQYCLLATSATLPIVCAVATRPIMYDGVRQFLFVVSSLAVIAGVAFARLRVQSVSRLWKVIPFSVAAASMLVTAADMIQLHPYEYVFFNRIFGGGVQDASRHFETDYWGLSYKEGAEWIGTHYPAPTDPRMRLRVASCSHPESTSHFLSPDQFEYVGSRTYEISADPDLFLATTRFNCHDGFDGRVVHVVERQGAPLLYVKEVGRDDLASR